MKEVKQLGDKIVCANETEIMEENPNAAGSANDESPFKPEFNLKLEIDQRPAAVYPYPVDDVEKDFDY